MCMTRRGFVKSVHLKIVFISIVYRSLLLYSMLASKLNMTADSAERWIVNLIREARLDAKIDAKKVSSVVDELSYYSFCGVMLL